VEIVSYPNPFNNELTIEIKNNKNTQLGIELNDVLGRTMFKIQGAKNQSSFKINCSELAKGLYFYRILESMENIGTGKVVKE
jgi:hypothetical protein